MSHGTSTENAAASDCAPPPALPPGAPPPAPAPTLPPAPKPSQHNRLIDLWHAMSEDDQALWRDMFASNKSPDDIREELRKRLDVLFVYNDQLEIFKRWEKDYQTRVEEAARQQLDQRLGLAPLPQADPAAARHAFLNKAYARAIATGDFNLGLKTVHQDLNVADAVLDREKFELKATATAAKTGAKTATQPKSAKPDQPDPADGISVDEKMQELRRKMFGDLPVDPAAAKPPRTAAPRALAAAQKIVHTIPPAEILISTVVPIAVAAPIAAAEPNLCESLVQPGVCPNSLQPVALPSEESITSVIGGLKEGEARPGLRSARKGYEIVQKVTFSRWQNGKNAK